MKDKSEALFHAIKSKEANITRAKTLLLAAFLFNLVPALPITIPGFTNIALVARGTALVIVGFMVLNLLADIYEKVRESIKPKIFAKFDNANDAILKELEKASVASNKIDISILGVAGIHWGVIANDLDMLLKSSRSISIDVRFLMVDPEWIDIDNYNDEWKHQISGATTAIKNFNGRAICKSRCTVDVGYYTAVPQFWGITINNSILFYCLTSWESDSDGGGGRLQIDRNPMTMLTLSDSPYANERISTFSGWFEYLWKKSEKKSTKRLPSNEEAEKRQK